MSGPNFYITTPFILTWIAAGALYCCGQEPIEMKIYEKRYHLAFSDDFEAGHNNWKTTDSKAWEIFSSQSNKSFGLTRRKSDYQPKFRSPHNIAILNEKRFSNFVMDLDVKNTKDTGPHRDCCLFFGYKDADHFYYVHLGAKPDPNSGQIMIVNEAARRPLTKNRNKVPWDDRWHKVRLKFDGASGLIEIYFDNMNKPLMSATDKTFLNGQIGIGSFDDMNQFDNIKIYTPILPTTPKNN